MNPIVGIRADVNAHYKSWFLYNNDSVSGNPFSGAMFLFLDKVKFGLSFSCKLREKPFF